MNTPQTIESGAGLLKANYEPSDTLDLALKKRREKIMAGKNMINPDDTETLKAPEMKNPHSGA